MITSLMTPPPSPVVTASTRTAKTSSSLRTATSAPVIAKTKIPNRSSTTSRTPGWSRVASMVLRVEAAHRPLAAPVPAAGVGRARPSWPATRPGSTVRDAPDHVGSALCRVSHLRRDRMKEWASHVKPQDLTLVGLTEDEQKLVLVSDSGEEFTLPADARLRAALRGEHARLGQLEITMESSLRPRDIQARIRAGASPEDVAAAAQTTLDRVMGYAIPVLAERAHIADRAQRASVRRSGGEGPSRVLTDAVAERLSARNVDPDSVAWDAWRREDGRWTLVADYRSGESARHAEFVFDAPGRYVVAEDDEARWLVGEQTAVRGPQPRGAAGPRRLSAVGTEDELPLGEDALELVSEPADGSSGEPAPERGQEAEQPVRPEPVVQFAAGDADWIATQATERPSARQEPREPESPEPEGREPGSPESESPEPESLAPASPAPESPAPESPARERRVELGSEADEPQPAPPQRASRKNRRASVPSWDEIMFGGGKRY